MGRADPVQGQTGIAQRPDAKGKIGAACASSNSAISRAVAL